MNRGVDVVKPGDQVVPAARPPVSVGGVRRGPTLADRWRRYGAITPLILLVVVFGAVNPVFLRPANLAGLLDQSAIVMIAGCGMTWVIVAGAIDLSIEGTMGVAAVVAGLLAANNVNHNDLGLWVIPIVVVLGALLGSVTGVIYAYGRLPSFVVTLAMWSVGLGVATALVFSGAAGGAPTLEDQHLLALAYAGAGGLSAISLIAVGCVVVGALVERHSVFGRRVAAVGGDESAAASSGLDVRRYKFLVMTVCGGTAALAGVLAMSRLGVGGATIGTGTLFTTITAVVIGGTPLSGGRGSVVNTAVGALTLTVLANGMVLSGVPAFYQQAVQGLIIIAVLTIGGWQARQHLRIVK
jgi:ribose transport system permease protein